MHCVHNIQKETDKMKRLISIILIVLSVTILIPGPVLAAPQLHKVTGGGIVDFLGYNETYGFTAVQVDASGSRGRPGAPILTGLRTNP